MQSWLKGALVGLVVYCVSVIGFYGGLYLRVPFSGYLSFSLWYPCLWFLKGPGSLICGPIGLGLNLILLPLLGVLLAYIIEKLKIRKIWIFFTVLVILIFILISSVAPIISQWVTNTKDRGILENNTPKNSISKVSIVGGEDKVTVWKRYDSGRGFELYYPSDWLADINAYNSGGAVLCPPELQENHGCAITRAVGGSIDPKAPIVVWYCSTDKNAHDCDWYTGRNTGVVNMGTNDTGTVFYLASLNDDRYAKAYEGIVKSFKIFRGQGSPSISVVSPAEESIWDIGTMQTVTYELSANWVDFAGTCVDAFLVNYGGARIPLEVGKYINVGGHSFTVTLVAGNPHGVSDAIVFPGRYRVEVNAYSCSENNNAFIASGTSANYVTITNP